MSAASAATWSAPPAGPSALGGAGGPPTPPASLGGSSSASSGRLPRPVPIQPSPWVSRACHAPPVTGRPYCRVSAKLLLLGPCPSLPCLCHPPPRSRTPFARSRRHGSCYRYKRAGICKDHSYPPNEPSKSCAGQATLCPF